MYNNKVESLQFFNALLTEALNGKYIYYIVYVNRSMEILRNAANDLYNVQRVRNVCEIHTLRINALYHTNTREWWNQSISVRAAVSAILIPTSRPINRKPFVL